jgi:hypothetical protein
VNEELSSKARALLEAVAVGDCRQDEAAVVELARRDESFRTRLAELDSVRRLLDETSEEARRTQKDARSWIGAPGEGRLRRSVGLTWQRRFLGARNQRVALFGGLLAAGLMFLVYLDSQRGDAEELQPVWMGGEQVELVHPRGTVEAFEPFLWKGDLPEGGEYRIKIIDAAASVPADAPLLEHRTTEQQWTPSTNEIQLLPDRIWVEVSVIARDGRVLGVSDLVLASR